MSDKKVFANEYWADKRLLGKYDDYHEHIMKSMRAEIADHIVMQIAGSKNGEKIVRMPQVEIRDSHTDYGVMYRQYIFFEDMVRCKDCRHYWKNGGDNSKGAVCLASPEDDAFCSEGERKAESP